MKKATFRHTMKTIASLLSITDNPKEMLVPIDNFPIWREHIVFCVSDGKRVREIMTQRFSSNMVFLSLLLGVEVGVLFSPSDIVGAIRCSMNTKAKHCFDKDRDDGTMTGTLKYDSDNLYFAIGIVLICDVIVTMIAILATFTAWGLVSAIGDDNAQCIVRSSVGLFATQLPSRLLITSLYLFFAWMLMVLFELLPGDGTRHVYPLAYLLAAFAVIGIWSVVSLYSAFGRLIIHTKAMNKKPVFNDEVVDSLCPFELTDYLLEETKRRQKAGKSVSEVYRYSSSDGIHGEPQAGVVRHRRSVIMRYQSGQESSPSMGATDRTMERSSGKQNGAANLPRDRSGIALYYPEKKNEETRVDHDPSKI